MADDLDLDLELEDDEPQQTGVSVANVFGDIIPSMIKGGQVTKANIQAIAQQVAEGVSEYGDPLYAFAVSKVYAEFLKAVQDGISEEALSLAEQHKGEETYKGLVFKIGTTGAKYDYSECEAWQKLDKEKAEIAEKIKRLEKKMVAIIGIKAVEDEEFGIICGAKLLKDKSHNVQFPIKTK